METLCNYAILVGFCINYRRLKKITSIFHINFTFFITLLITFAVNLCNLSSLSVAGLKKKNSVEFRK